MFTVNRRITPSMIIVCALAIASGTLHAQDLGNGWGPNALEVARLPLYCQQFFRNKTLPPNCDGVHHLCAGRVLMNRVMDINIPKQERRRIYNNAKQEVNYIFARENPSCKMMDEARATQNSLKTMEVFVR